MEVEKVLELPAPYLSEFQQAWGEWADKTFPNSDRETITSHFREEAREFAGGIEEIDDGAQGSVRHVLHKPSHDPVEAADCLLLLLHHAHKEGYDLMSEAIKKAKINVARDWDVADDAGHGHFKHTSEPEHDSFHAYNCPAFADRNASCTCEEPEEDS